MTQDEIQKRLEYLRGEIIAERISTEEIIELQSLAEHIDKGDTLLLEWAGIPEKSKQITNVQDLCDFLSAEEPKRLGKRLYKATSCGAWIQATVDGPGSDHVRIGSIVEGCDFGTHIYKLTYPFDGDLFDRCIQAIEAEAKALWDWANEERDDGQTDAERGLDAPDVCLDYLDLEQYHDGQSS